VSGDAAGVLRRCDELAACSEEPGRLTRRVATPALRQASDLVASWMEAAGMAVRRDPVGNLSGRYAGTGERTLLLGSHLDSVVDAGRYDGPLGVLTALAVVERLAAAGRRLPFAVEVLGFADEEGVRYSTAYLGSSVLAGSFDPGWLDRVDADGIPLRDALAAEGGDPAGIAGEARDPASLVGWIEVHIEQGPRLQAKDLPVGVVSAIQGASRAAVTFAGVAGHAGTVPMEARRDALAAAAEWVLAVEEEGRTRPGLVATVGRLSVEPGAPNVIPGKVDATVDVRHADDAQRRAALEAVRHASVRRGVAGWSVLQDIPAVECSPRLRQVLGQAVAAQGLRVEELASGAGHDAVALSPICPVAMLFVRCRDGISHNPAESVEEADVAVAIDVLADAVDRLAAA
jgi:hydantoinase/carbamoylase family amidase